MRRRQSGVSEVVLKKKGYHAGEIQWKSWNGVGGGGGGGLMSQNGCSCVTHGRCLCVQL